jgi:branched-chain amino acid transport system substrate-binding protein
VKSRRIRLVPVLALGTLCLAATIAPVQTIYDPAIGATKIIVSHPAADLDVVAADPLPAQVAIAKALPPAQPVHDPVADPLPAQVAVPKANPPVRPAYDPGVTDTEIKIGNIMPYTGPAAAYGLIGKAIAAYFKKVNAEGGINGRKIEFISYDDSYNPAKAIEAARKLVESDRVLLVFQSLGTPSNSAIQKYMNDNKVPQLFVASGATKWDDPAHYPWTMGWQPNYQTEGHIFGQYLLANHPHGRIAILYQNDEYGKDYVKGLKDSLAGAIPVVSEVGYETTDANVNAQISKLKASGADIFFNVATPKFAAQAIKRAAEIGWKPVQLLNSVSNSVGSVLKPAGFDNAQGILAANYMKEPGDPRWQDDPGYREWLDFMNRYFPEGDKNNTLSVYGYSVAQTLVQVLKQCGDQLTRENVMKQAANLKGVRLGMLLPGVVINTSATDFAPIEQMQMMRFSGDRWQPFGPVLSGIDPGAVSQSLREIFHYGTGTRDTADRLNANTVIMMTGAFGGTYEQFGADLASVLDDGDNFRLLPIVGQGSVQDIADILYLKGVDLGIVRSDTLDYIEKRGYASNIKKQFSFIAKLYNEEVHVLAAKSVVTLADLDGKTVAVDSANGGTFVTAINVFDRLGIRPHFLYIEQRVALQKLKSGAIDAVFVVEGKPLEELAQFTGTDFHFVPVNYDKALQAEYLPTQLTAQDYPNLIAPGQSVDTIAASAVLAAYNWAPRTDRHRRLELFVEAFFSKIRALQRPPFHPKWREVALNAPLEGWTRFPPAQTWLDRNSKSLAAPQADNDLGRKEEVEALFRQFLDFQSSHYLKRNEDREALFQEFLDWKKRQAAGTK